MKHLKYFESKYVIEHSKYSTLYHIMEILNESEKGTELKTEYYTTTEYKKIIKIKNTKSFIYSPQDMKDYIIYTGTLDECIDMLNVIINANKYNL